MVLKNMIKKNQVMITALAIMIAVAGYLNFAGTKVTDEEIMTVNGEIETDDMGNLALYEEETDYSVLLDLSEEDMEQKPDEAGEETSADDNGEHLSEGNEEDIQDESWNPDLGN